MKKFISLIAMATMALVMTAGSALAAFESNHLVRVIYSTVGSEEIATDLGVVSDVLASTDGTAFALDSFQLTDFSGASWADLNVAYFAVDGINWDGYVSATAGINGVTKLSVRASSKNDILALGNNVQNYYQTLPLVGGNTVVASQAYSNAYNMVANGGSPGYLGSFLYEPIAEANLADLANPDGYADLGLYTAATSPYGLFADEFTQVAVLRTLADGSTVVNPVPVPASVLLFGTGLVGLIGLRRKSA